MKRLILVYLLVFCCQCGQGRQQFGNQKEEIDQFNDNCLSIVNRFYEYLVSQDSVTIKDYYDLFGSYALEEEEYKFFKRCEEQGERNCDQLANEVFGNIANFESIMFSEIRQLKNQLLPTTIEVGKVISNSSIFETGIPGIVEVVLSFPNSMNVYFHLSVYEGEATKIQDIFTSNGQSIFNSLETRGNKVLKRIAIVNDPDGYTNIREWQGVDAPIIGKVLEGNLFFYIPNSKSDWCKVQLINSCKWGYMHKSRITFYGMLNRAERVSIQEKVKSLYKGKLPCYQ